MIYILTITDQHGTRQEPYATREQAERAIYVLTGYGDLAEIEMHTEVAH